MIVFSLVPWSCSGSVFTKIRWVKCASFVVVNFYRGLGIFILLFVFFFYTPKPKVNYALNTVHTPCFVVLLSLQKGNKRKSLHAICGHFILPLMHLIGWTTCWWEFTFVCQHWWWKIRRFYGMNCEFYSTAYHIECSRCSSLVSRFQVLQICAPSESNTFHYSNYRYPKCSIHFHINQSLKNMMFCFVFEKTRLPSVF